ncbi:MAG TPA: hypothetical protein VLE74_04340 [Candidatus Saccharimonadales bacterium]|nr:hypothetical protein [Candidatus Saccharimonadales bacterium]
MSPALYHPSHVAAATASGWQAGRIIDDSIFTDKNAMSVAEIQAFLDSKVGTGGYDSVPGQCDFNGARNAAPFDSSITRTQYGASRNPSNPKFTCLNSYYEVPKTSPGPDVPASNYGGAPIPAGAKSAAQLIWDAAQASNISPKVLLVTIHKESAGPLTTDDWPFQKQYTYAMGAHCPDSGPNGSANCDPNYAGFSIQISESAALLRYYLDNMLQPWWNYNNSPSHPGCGFGYGCGFPTPYQSNKILYNPNVNCGSSNIFIETKATAALYTYTPYQPNATALSNLYGSQTDGCSSYGNRNFWRIYNDWFGPTTSNSTANVLSFIRLNHSSGNVESVGYPSISAYSYPARYNLTGYPAVTPDGNVIPLFWPPNGDLGFLRLNHSSGNVELVSYSAGSGFKQLANYSLTGYPDVAPDGAVVPLFWPPNGDLVFLRLNHSSGNVELVSYSASSNFKKVVNYSLTGYPAVAPDGNVIPLFTPTGDLSFIRLNYSSGNVEVVTYSASSNFKQIVDHSITSYPDVAPDGAVVPLFTR